MNVDAAPGWFDPAWLVPVRASKPIPGVAIVGFGSIAASEHLAVYRRNDVPIVGVLDPSPEAQARARAEGLAIFPDLDTALAEDDVGVVDVATPVTVRPAVVAQSLRAGKHVLAQKPFALDVDVARGLVEQAEHADLVLAVNVNARWSAAWRVCGRLVSQGRAGTVRAVTHVVELDLTTQAGGPLDATGEFAIVDVLTHWIDVSGTWIDLAWPIRVQAEEHRLPGQPAASISPLGATVSFVTAAGTAVSIHLIGTTTPATARWSAWVHGTEATIRTRSAWSGPDEVVLDDAQGSSSVTLDQGWVPLGFECSILEAMAAAADGRAPENSARSHLPMLALMLGARQSAAAGGRPVVVSAP